MTASSRALRIVVHDYAGHALHIQLSRWLAQQGHQVWHLYSADIESPRGHIKPKDSDPSDFSVVALSLGHPLPKYKPIRRWLDERKYAALAADHIRAIAPDMVLTANAPPAIQTALQMAARSVGAGFINWLQDIVSIVAAPVLRRSFPLIGGFAAMALKRQEFATLRTSDHVISITEDFVPLLIKHGVPATQISVIHNWAPAGEFLPYPRDNLWSRRHALTDTFVFLYSGTLGLKHDPAALADLARSVQSRADVVVITQGLGRTWLEQTKEQCGLENLRLLDYQDIEELPLVLATADVLVALLEPQAGVMSVPSKVMTYLCAARPILAAIPGDNLAAKVICEAGAGLVPPLGDRPSFLAAAEQLMADAALRQRSATAARTYADKAFNMDSIGPCFLAVMNKVLIKINR